MNTITPGQLADELESGRWRKATGALRSRTGGRCCLGVACELIGLEWNLCRNNGDTYYTAISPTGSSDSALIPPGVTAIAAPFLKDQIRFAALNDNHRGWGDVITLLREIEQQPNKPK